MPDSNPNVQPELTSIPSDIPSETNSSKHSKSHTLRNLLIGGLSIIMLLTAGWYIGTQDRTSSQPQVPESVPISATPALPLAIDVDTLNDQPFLLAFLSQGRLWTKTVNGQEQPVTDSNTPVYRFDQSHNGSVIAYISGENVTNDNQYAYIDPTAVRVNIPSTQLDKEIYALQPTIPDKTLGDYVLQIRDVQVTKDGRYVLISTSDSIFRYDVATDELTPVLANPILDFSTFNQGSVWGYSHPQLSPNASQLVFRIGHYEGFSTGLLDLNTNSETELPFSGYTGGERVEDWLSDTRLLLQNYEGPWIPREQSRLSSVDANNPTDRTVLAEFSGTIEQSVLAGDTVYALIFDIVPSQDIPPEEGYTDSVNRIVKIELLTGELTELYSSVQRNVDQGVQEKQLSNILLDPSGETLYVSGQINTVGSSEVIPAIWRLSTAAPSDLVEYIPGGSF